jgi:SAM-dependent methyltransferase
MRFELAARWYTLSGARIVDLFRFRERAAMNARRASRTLLLSAFALLVASAAVLAQQAATKQFEPTVGQAGKDVVWVPTPQPLVEKMLDLAKVTPQDFVMDLGSGDGRTVITAAKRGARAQGVEYNPDMVELSQRNAKAAGVDGKANFVKADLFETDFSKAQVVTMFLLPSINMRLRPTILKMKPGTRVVSNTFTMEDWEPDQSETIAGDCVSWCTAHLWIVPAQVQGTWTLANQSLTLTQKFQMLTGKLGTTDVTGRLRGDEITLTAGGMKYTGKVEGGAMKGANWSAARK